MPSVAPDAHANPPLVSAAGTDFAVATLLAWDGKLTILALFEAATKLTDVGLNSLAVVLYQTWLQRNHTTHNHLAYFNLGAALFAEQDKAGARQAYSRAIQLDPTFAQARYNLGLIYESLGQYDAAVGEWLWIESNVSAQNSEQKSNLLLALNSLGRHFENTRRYAEALSFLTRSLHIEPNQPDVIHHWVFLRQRLCLWPIYSPIQGISEGMLRESTSALAMLNLSDDPEQQLSAAKHYVREKVAANVPAITPTAPYKHQKIRVAYCSSDFCRHPVAMLTAELFELHDRDQFEVYAFCWTKDDGSPLRQRVLRAMDHVELIADLSDEAAAQLIRQHEIDILVDLQGQTLGARTNMLAYRPAPIQITYLGLPATTGLPSIDYVIADRFLIPPESAQHYSEKPLYMPDIYQVNDRQRKSNPTRDRASYGLPADRFVFCSFNNNFKFTPEVFGVWMNILNRVPSSVLWLLADNPWAQANLLREAVARGVDESRLIFGERLAPEDYLGRYPAADLFLDTFPFNAGTTASDALWMGLPVLTHCGRSFAARMAGALLTAAQLDELITYDWQAYEDKAVALAASPQECQRLRQHLHQVRENGVLFDTPRFVKNLEAQFQVLVNEIQ